MRIVFFDFVIHFGGAPQLSADTAKRLAVDNEVEVVDVYGSCRQYLKVLQEAGIKTHVLLPEVKDIIIGYQNNKVRRLWELIRRIPLFWQLRKRLIRKIIEITPDVIWTNGIKSLSFLSTSWRLRKYPIVICAHGWYKREQVPAYGRWLIKHRTRGVLAVSNPTSENLQNWGVAREKIHIVFNSVDFENIINDANKEPCDLLPGINGFPHILVPATLLRTKGQHTAIKAVARLKSQGISPTLWLAGDVVGNDYSYLEYLKDLAGELGVSENVYFLGWRDDIPAIMAQSDVVVLPTHTEGFGRVILEAMLLRRPAVATPVGGIKDLIQDGQDGLFFPVDDDKALAQHLVRLTTDSQFAAELIEKGYKTATEKFNPEIHTKRVHTALARAAESVNR